MCDAPCVTSQHTFYKTCYKLLVSVFTIEYPLQRANMVEPTKEKSSRSIH